MATKSRNYRGAVCAFSTAISVIAAEVAFFFGCLLALTYSVKFNTGIEKIDEYGEPYWVQTSVEGIDPIISELWMVEVAALFIALAAIVLSLMKAGRKAENGQILLNRFDTIFTDVQIIAGGVLFCGIAFMSMAHVDYICGGSWYQNDILGLLSTAEKEGFEEWNGYIGSGFEPRWIELLFCIIANLLMMTGFLLLLQSLVKKLRVHAFWKHTIIGKLWCYIYDAAKESEGIFWKALGIAVGASLLSATWFGLVPILILIFIFVPKWVKKYEAVREGVRQVKEGNLDYKIPVEDNGELDRLAAGINQISQATSIAVQNELKNQRMKTDLISNVSHDLKTPLTSMVSYVDLLKTEGLDSENAPEYLAIIDEKTRRLQKLTEDLFEAAKASSGAIPVNMGKIEMTSIVNQAMAELDERMAASDLQVIFTNKADSVYVMADGQLLWRVIENLLVNVSKYALAHSRVYLDIVESDHSILLEIKNMSREQLNISADELMERFKRGDESRNTEGSGLGLSIAKDLTKLMEGDFEISIDGDLFKASVSLKKAV
ncbi:MAG: histidine kinase dimerization/phospho-acceptor domain-containing protein [Emergencia sp.]